MSSPSKKSTVNYAHQRVDSSRGTSRTTTASSSSSTTVSRTHSPRAGKSSTPVSAKAAVKRPGMANSAGVVPDMIDADEHERRAEWVGLLDDLKDQLRKAEASAEEYRGQLEGYRARLEEALRDQGSLEMQLHTQGGKMEGLETEKRDLLRQHREFKDIFEAERLSLLQEKEQMVAEEQELRTVIQRLKDNLAQKEARRLSDANGAIAARTTDVPSEFHSNGSDILLHKDKTIESLRLELAEAHIKLIELENMKGDRVQDLEKMLLETRMANAKLMEDQESFQLLLSEKTLNGDFARANVMQVADQHPRELSNPLVTSGSSLADELSSAEDGGASSVRRLEAEVTSLQDQNKALTVYINSIIERLLQHKGYETILDKTQMMGRGTPSGSALLKTDMEKDLPAPPAKEEPSILQRTRSLMSGGRGTRPRPFSQIITPVSALSETVVPSDTSSNTVTLSSLRRSDSVGARNISPERPQGHQPKRDSSPGPSALGQFRPRIPMVRQISVPSATGISGAGVQNRTPRIPSGTQSSTTETAGSSSNSVMSDKSGDTESSSAPHIVAAIAGNKLRPLRLVQENKEHGGGDQGMMGRRQSVDGTSDVDLSKKAKRSSWMGWFNKGKTEDGVGGGAGGSSSKPMGGGIAEE
ncbi:MAG: hypothetical protein M1816_006463 [Peltula sp. TS41687]|nr:MAG: hypothetical protein M1816_006463 [Peltula sp. TS41687]